MFIVVALFAAISSTAYRDTSADRHELRHVPERDLDRDPRRRAGRGRRGRREQPRAEQLDPRQGLRHGQATCRASSPPSPARRRPRPTASGSASRTTRRTWAAGGCGGSARTSSSSSRSRASAAITIIVFSLVAYSTVFRNPDLPDSSGFDFIALEGQVLDDAVGQWFGTLFLADRRGQPVRRRAGHRRLRLAAGRRRHPRRLHRATARAGPRAACTSRSSGRWSSFGCAILLVGFDQPLVLVTISTVLGGAIMIVYTCLLLVTNRRYLPEADPAARVPDRPSSCSPWWHWGRRRRSSASTSSGTCCDARVRRTPARRARAVGGAGGPGLFGRAHLTRIASLPWVWEAPRACSASPARSRS